MSVEEVTSYIENLEEPKRSTLMAVRAMLMNIEPSFEQVIAWKSPQFKYQGKNAIGLCAFKNHLTFSPQSAAVMNEHAADLSGYVTSQNSFQFDVDEVLPEQLLRKLVEARLAELR